MARSGHRALDDRRFDRQQRHETPDQPGAHGSEHIATPTEAEDEARHRLGKTAEHVSEDTPTPDEHP
ncbi:MAG TPA: hypothetical protein VFW66_07715 [Gemmatimonadales bacterium]|nr:hypothetical protein [Gemmatimonadales bacterium]